MERHSFKLQRVGSLHAMLYTLIASDAVINYVSWLQDMNGVPYTSIGGRADPGSSSLVDLRSVDTGVIIRLNITVISSEECYWLQRRPDRVTLKFNSDHVIVVSPKDQELCRANRLRDRCASTDYAAIMTEHHFSWFHSVCGVVCYTVDKTYANHAITVASPNLEVVINGRALLGSPGRATSLTDSMVLTTNLELVPSQLSSRVLIEEPGTDNFRLALPHDLDLWVPYEDSLRSRDVFFNHNLGSAVFTNIQESYGQVASWTTSHQVPQSEPSFDIADKETLIRTAENELRRPITALKSVRFDIHIAGTISAISSRMKESENNVQRCACHVLADKGYNYAKCNVECAGTYDMFAGDRYLGSSPCKQVGMAAISSLKVPITAGSTLCTTTSRAVKEAQEVTASAPSQTVLSESTSWWQSTWQAVQTFPAVAIDTCTSFYHAMEMRLSRIGAIITSCLMIMFALVAIYALTRCFPKILRGICCLKDG